MNDRKMKLRVGGFVTLSLTLLLVMLFFFGLSEIFVDKVKIYTTFAESIQGLSIGSDVTYRGTKIGSVSAISISVSQQLTRVEMELDTDYFVEGELKRGESKLGRFDRIFGKELRKGLCCRLLLTGITGMRVIELDYFDQEQKTQRGTWEKAEDLFFIPSVLSPFKDITSTLSTSLERISRINFEEISDELETSLAQISALLSNPSLVSTLERLNNISTHLEDSARSFADTMNQKRMDTIASVIEEDLRRIGEFVRQMNQTMNDMALKESTESIREAAEAVRMLQGGSAGVILQLNSTLEAIRNFCDQLNRNPGILFGRERAPARKP